MKNPYVAEIKENINIAGISVGNIEPNQTASILARAFIDSFDKNFQKYATNILSMFVSRNEIASLNRLLIVIKPDNRAFIYRFFPMQLGILAKRDMSKGTLVSSNDIADLASIHFQDDFFKIDIADGDKVVFLIREGVNFGLYFYFSGLATNASRESDIAYHFKRFLYRSLFDFLAQETNLAAIIDDGWFPFIRLIGSTFEKLIQYYSEGAKYETFISEILDSYTDEVIINIMNSWSKSPFFGDKKMIIEAGINAYLRADYVSCIKNIASEIEGIIRTSLYIETQNSNPSMREIKNHLISKGISKFRDDRALGFPTLFSSYLENSVFANSYISDPTIVVSRHTVGHGVAKFENYTRIRAFQIILTLDQVFFYL